MYFKTSHLSSWPRSWHRRATWETAASHRQSQPTQTTESELFIHYECLKSSTSSKRRSKTLHRQSEVNGHTEEHLWDREQTTRWWRSYDAICQCGGGNVLIPVKTDIRTRLIGSRIRFPFHYHAPAPCHILWMELDWSQLKPRNGIMRHGTAPNYEERFKEGAVSWFQAL